MPDSRYSAGEFVIGEFANVFYFLGRLEPLQGISQKDRIMITVMLQHAVEEMKRLGLRGSARHAEDLIEILEGKYPGGGEEKVHDIITVVRATLHLELENTVFLHVSHSDADFYRAPLDGVTEDVENNFTSTLEDFREAARCYALQRPTASVFHSMRVWEVGLIALGMHLQVPEAANKNWHNLLDQIEKQIRQVGPSSGPNWKSDKEWLSDVAAQFRFVKDAWRNNAMHVHRDYSQQRAREILNATRTFMCQLATKIHE